MFNWTIIFFRWVETLPPTSPKNDTQSSCRCGLPFHDLAGQTTFSLPFICPEVPVWFSLPGSQDDILVTHIPKMIVFFLYFKVSPEAPNYGVIFWGVWIFCFFTWMIREFGVKLESFGLYFPAKRHEYISLYQVLSRGYYKFSMIDLCIHYTHLYTMYYWDKNHPQTQSQLSNEGNLPKAHADWMGLSLASSKEEARCSKLGAEIRWIYMNLCSPGVGTRFAWFFFCRFRFGSLYPFCLVEFPGDYMDFHLFLPRLSVSLELVWCDWMPLNVRMWSCLWCPSWLCCKLMIRKQQAIYIYIYHFCLFLAFFFKRFEVSFAWWCFWNPLKPSFCLSMQRVLKWKGEVPISKISCVIASFFGDLIQYGNAGWNPTGTDEFLQVPRLSPKISVWDCTPILPRDATVYLMPVWRMYFDNYDYHMFTDFY